MRAGGLAWLSFDESRSPVVRGISHPLKFRAEFAFFIHMPGTLTVTVRRVLQPSATGGIADFGSGFFIVHVIHEVIRVTFEFTCRCTLSIKDT